MAVRVMVRNQVNFFFHRTTRLDGVQQPHGHNGGLAGVSIDSLCAGLMTTNKEFTKMTQLQPQTYQGQTTPMFPSILNLGAWANSDKRGADRRASRAIIFNDTHYGGVCVFRNQCCCLSVKRSGLLFITQNTVPFPLCVFIRTQTRRPP